MFTSLRSRLWLTYAALILVILSVVAFSLLIYLVRNPLVDRQALSRLDFAANLVSRRLEQDFPRQLLVDDLIFSGEGTASFRIVVLSPADEVIFDTAPEEGAIRWSAAAEDQSPRGRIRDAQGKVWLYASRILSRQRQLFVLTPGVGGRQLLASPRLWEVFKNEFLPPFIRVGIGVSFIALLFSSWMSRWISKPLQEMADAAKAIAGGNTRRISSSGPEEVQSLADALNEMLSKVQASQNSQKDFVANVSHELKTPLTSIQGFAAAIADGTASTQDEVEQAGMIIQAEAERMDRMVKELLDLARIDAGIAELNKNSLNLNDLLSECVEKMKTMAEHEQVALSADLAPLPTWEGDRDRTFQIFVNLVDNAVHNTPPGGRVQVHAEHRDDMIQVDVKDTGVGIPEDEIPRIFERFYQVEKSREKSGSRGTGLGLSITRELVQAHGGEINVTSELGRGSTFRVQLPVCQPNDQTAETGIT